MNNIVLMTETDPGTYQIKYAGTTYQPTSNPVLMGTVLYGLKPFGIEFLNCSVNPKAFLDAANRAAMLLDDHANRMHRKRRLSERLTVNEVGVWINNAIAIAPNPAAAEKLRGLITENLGPFAFVD